MPSVRVYLAYTYDVSAGHMLSMFVYLNGQVLLRKDYGSSTAHYYNDDLSSNLRYVWSWSSGLVTEGAFRYKPFGTMATPLVPLAPTTQVLGFAGTEMSTAGYHMGAREYDPEQGRFVSRDPLPGHAYAYGHDNSLSWRDPSGLDAVGDFSKWLGGLANGFASLLSWEGSVTANVWKGAGSAFAGGFQGGVQFWTTTVPNWWNGLSPRDRMAILVIAVVAVSIVTLGVGGAILGSGAMVNVAIGAGVTGTISAGTTAGISYATTGHISLPAVAASFAVGAVLGGVTAGMGAYLGATAGAGDVASGAAGAGESAGASGEIAAASESDAEFFQSGILRSMIGRQEGMAGDELTGYLEWLMKGPAEYGIPSIGRATWQEALRIIVHSGPIDLMSAGFERLWEWSETPSSVGPVGTFFQPVYIP